MKCWKCGRELTTGDGLGSLCSHCENLSGIKVSNRSQYRRLVAQGAIADDIADLRRQLNEAMLLSPAEKCRKFSIKNCHVCENIDCGDNFSPAVKRIRELEGILDERNGIETKNTSPK